MLQSLFAEDALHHLDKMLFNINRQSSRLALSPVGRIGRCHNENNGAIERLGLMPITGAWAINPYNPSAERRITPSGLKRQLRVFL